MSKMFTDLIKGLGEINSFLDEGKRTGFKAHIPDQIDVRRIRGKLQLTQSKFSEMFGFSLNAVKHWEAGRRTPESSARTLLTVIDRNPEAVVNALHGRRTAPQAVSAKQPAKAATSIRRPMLRMWRRKLCDETQARQSFHLSDCEQRPSV